MGKDAPHGAAVAAQARLPGLGSDGVALGPTELLNGRQGAAQGLARAGWGPTLAGKAPPHPLSRLSDASLCSLTPQ